MPDTALNHSPVSDAEEPMAIAIMGPTGTGKTSASDPDSRFVNLVSGSKLPVGDTLVSCTGSIQFGDEVEINGRSVILIDTPGFDDTSGGDGKIFRMMAGFLAKSYREGKRLGGVIYMHRISDVRMGGTASRNFRLAMSVCGVKVMANVVIVTTFWNEEEEETNIVKEQELKDAFFKVALQRGARMMRHDRTKENAHDIINSILETPDSAPLTIQTELIDQRVPLRETSAAKEIFEQFDAQLSDHETELKQLQSNLESLPVTEEERKREIIDQARKLEGTIAELRAGAKAMAEKCEEQDRLLAQYLQRSPKRGKRRNMWWKRIARNLNQIFPW